MEVALPTLKVTSSRGTSACSSRKSSSSAKNGQVSAKVNLTTGDKEYIEDFLNEKDKEVKASYLDVTSRHAASSAGSEREKQTENVKEVDQESNLDLSEEPIEFDDTGQRAYENACKKYQVVPSSIVQKKLPFDEEIDIKHYGLGPRGAKAVAIPLVINNNITTLNLKNNFLEKEGVIEIGRMLRENTTITDLDLSENNVQTAGAKVIATFLRSNSRLHKLNIADNGFTDSDAAIMAQAIEENDRLKDLNLSHNQFGVQAGITFQSVIAENDVLEHLDLSWNNFRGKGARAICKGVRDNVRLKTLNVAWNGFSDDGAEEMGAALAKNGSLQELDMTCNRITCEGFLKLIERIDQNDTLTTLMVGKNQIRDDSATIALQLLRKIQSLNLQLLDFSDIVFFSDKFKQALEKIEKKHPALTVNHGYQHSYGKRKLVAYNPVREAMEALHKFIIEKNITVAELFSTFDEDGSMSVTYDEFKEGLKMARIPLSPLQVEALIKELDKDGDGEIDFSELVVGAEYHVAT